MVERRQWDNRRRKGEDPCTSEGDENRDGQSHHTCDRWDIRGNFVVQGEGSMGGASLKGVISGRDGERSHVLGKLMRTEMGTVVLHVTNGISGAPL
jgi:hypothetical protein